MSKRLSTGLAINPQRELRLFRKMALQGEHLTGTSYAGHGWEFTPGEKEDAIFDMTTEHDANEDFFTMCQQAGWNHVLTVGDTHIFKAAPGTVGLHTEDELTSEVLEKQRNSFAKTSVITAVIFAAVVVLIANVDWPNFLEVALCVITMIPLVYSVVPLIGYQTKVMKARRDDVAA